MFVSDRRPVEPASEPAVQPTEREIQLRAYYKFCARGFLPGDPVADWLEAERELKAGCQGDRGTATSANARGTAHRQKAPKPGAAAQPVHSGKPRSPR